MNKRLSKTKTFWTSGRGRVLGSLYRLLADDLHLRIIAAHPIWMGMVNKLPPPSPSFKDFYTLHIGITRFSIICNSIFLCWSFTSKPSPSCLVSSPSRVENDLEGLPPWLVLRLLLDRRLDLRQLPLIVTLLLFLQLRWSWWSSWWRWTKTY